MNQLTVDNDFIYNVVENYSDMLLRIAYQNMNSLADAEDVVQETFLKLMQQPSFQDESHMKAWLIRVAINRCKDLRKSAWFRKTTPLDEDVLPLSERQQSIVEDIRKLPHDYRNVIYLYYFEGYTVPEIARILDKKENTISSQLTRSRHRLKHILLEGGYQHE